MELFQVDGARVLVTGASRGIGRGIATALAEAGADVAVAARTAEALAETVAQIEAAGRRAVPVVGDLAESGAAERVVNEAAAALGGLDALIANAGVAPQDEDGSSRLIPFTTTTDEDWQKVVEVNLHSTVRACRAAYPFLAKSSAPSLTLIASVCGMVGTPGLETYATTKAAQLSLVQSLALEWAKQGIRVNAVCPGWVRTDMTESIQDTPLDDWLIAHVPQQRWVEVKEIADAAVFLSSGAASAITGHALVVDGGLSVPTIGLDGREKPASPFAA